MNASPRGRVNLPEEHAEGGALARAVVPEQAEDFALRNLERELVQRAAGRRKFLRGARAGSLGR